MKEHQIKKATWDDVHLIAPLFDQYRSFYQQSSNIAAAEDFLDQRIFLNESVIFFAFLEEKQGTIVTGFTQLYPYFSSIRLTKNWILNDLFVHPEFRRQYLAKRLIQTAVSFARSSGAGFIQLETARDNYQAQSLYETMGFRKQQPDAQFFTYQLDIFRKNLSDPATPCDF